MSDFAEGTVNLNSAAVGVSGSVNAAAGGPAADAKPASAGNDCDKCQREHGTCLGSCAMFMGQDDGGLQYAICTGQCEDNAKSCTCP